MKLYYFHLHVLYKSIINLFSIKLKLNFERLLRRNCLKIFLNSSVFSSNGSIFDDKFLSKDARPDARGNCVGASQLELEINETLTERWVYKTLVEVFVKRFQDKSSRTFLDRVSPSSSYRGNVNRYQKIDSDEPSLNVENYTSSLPRKSS